MGIKGGASNPVHVVTDAELADGTFELAGKVAIPVYNFDTARKIVGGAQRPVYVVTEAQIDAGEYKLSGGDAIPVSDAVDTRAIAGRTAVPVYVVAGTLGLTAPAAPTGLTATAVSGSQIDLEWTASAGATGYRIYWSTNGVDFAELVDQAGVTYSNTSLGGVVTYTYYVIAHNTAGDSTASSTAAVAYHQRLLATQAASVIGLWRLNETSGTVADNAEGTAARDGAYGGGVTLNNALFDNGDAVPIFDGVNGRVNLYTASLDSAINFQEGALSMWIKVAAGTWTDSTARRAIHIVAGTNDVTIAKLAANNSLYLEQRASNTARALTTTAVGGVTDWIHLAIVWSYLAGWVKFYVQGALASTALASGVDSGQVLSSNNTLIGLEALSTSALPWAGWISHVTLWTAQLADSEIARLYSAGAAHPSDQMRIPIDRADVASDGTIYAARRYVVSKSTDGGETWASIYAIPGLPASTRCVFVDSNDYIFVSGANTSSDNGLYRSIDGGVNFALVHSMDANTSIWAMDEDSAGNLYIGEYSVSNAGQMQIWKSDDDGATWTQVYVNDLGAGSQDHIHDIRVNPANGWIYATLGDPTNDNLLRSKDAGATWAVIYSSATEQLVPLAFLDGSVYAGTDKTAGGNKIYRFDDDGSASITPTEVLALSGDQDLPFYAGGETDGKIFFSTYKQGLTGEAAIFVSSDGTNWTTPYTTLAASTNQGYIAVSRHDRNGTFYYSHDVDYGIKFIP